MKKNNLKSNLSEHLKEQPTSSFSKNVMQQIQEEVFLKSELKAGLIQKAPANFAASVLKECLPNSVVENYEPVISKKAWYVIGAVFVLFISLSFNNSTAPSLIPTKYITDTLNVINTSLSVFVNYLNSHSFIGLTLLGIFSLITLETFFKLNNFTFKKV